MNIYNTIRLVYNKKNIHYIQSVRCCELPKRPQRLLIKRKQFGCCFYNLHTDYAEQLWYIRKISLKPHNQLKQQNKLPLLIKIGDGKTRFWYNITRATYLLDAYMDIPKRIYTKQRIAYSQLIYTYIKALTSFSQTNKNR